MSKIRWRGECACARESVRSVAASPSVSPYPTAGAQRVVLVARRLAGLAGFTCVLWATSACAQIVDTTLWATDGAVCAVVPAGDRVFIGGEFSRVGPTTGGGAAIDASTGRLVRPFPQVSGEVYACVTDGAGGWYIGGAFTAVASVPRQGLARVLADGSVSNWDPAPSWDGFNPPAVYALALNGNILYVGGTFFRIGGAHRSGIAALDVASGNATPWDPDCDGKVEALALSGSKVYVGGYFGAIGGEVRRALAALDATTAHATTWDPQAWGEVAALQVKGGMVYAAGFFEYVGGKNRRYIAALDTLSGMANAWDPAPDAFGYVNALAVSETAVYAAGYFYRIGGKAWNYIAALDPPPARRPRGTPIPTAASSRWH